MTDLQSALDAGPLPACDHLSERMRWMFPRTWPRWCSTCEGLRCQLCHEAHLVEHRAEPCCADCLCPLGPDREDAMVRYPVATTRPVPWLAVTFPDVGGVVLDFDDVTIDEVAIVCLACAAYRGAFDALDG